MAFFLFIIIAFSLFYVYGTFLDDQQKKEEEKKKESSKLSITASYENFSSNGFARDMSNRITHLCENIIRKFLNPNNEYLARNNYNPEMAKSFLLSDIRISISPYGIKVNSRVNSHDCENYISFVSNQIRSSYLSDDEVVGLGKAICGVSRKWEFRNNEIYLKEGYWGDYIYREASELQKRYYNSIGLH